VCPTRLARQASTLKPREKPVHTYRGGSRKSQGSRQPTKGGNDTRSFHPVKPQNPERHISRPRSGAKNETVGTRQAIRNQPTRIRPFYVGEIVSLSRPERKPGQSQKSWVGPFKVIGKLSNVNYQIVNLKGKVSMVHVERLTKAHNPDIWWSKKAHEVFRNRPAQREEPEEDSGSENGSGLSLDLVTLSRIRSLTRQNPRLDSPEVLDTPEVSQQCLDSPEPENDESGRVSSNSPTPRCETSTTTSEAPNTELQSRLRSDKQRREGGR
jgi:hypothetical protein